jgi:hypothetical protein
MIPNIIPTHTKVSNSKISIRYLLQTPVTNKPQNKDYSENAISLFYKKKPTDMTCRYINFIFRVEKILLST